MCKIWSLSLGLLLRTVKFPTGINVIVVDPSEYALSTGGIDGRIYIVTLNVGIVADGIHRDGIIGTLIDHSRAITTLAFSMDGVFIVLGSEDCTVYIWDTISYQLLRIFRHRKGPISSFLIVHHLSFSHESFVDVQGSFVGKRRSFLAPTPLNKYLISRAGNFDPSIFKGLLVILPSHDDSMHGGCFNTLLAMK